MFPTNPASEMALGVRRDSISRLRAISRTSAAFSDSRPFERVRSRRSVRWGSEATGGSLPAIGRQEAADEIDHLVAVRPGPVAGPVEELDACLAAEGLGVGVGELRGDE